MKTTGPCLKKLNRGTALKLMKRLMLIMKSNSIEKLALNFVENAQQYDVIHNMKIEDQNNLLKTLCLYSNRESGIGIKSSRLYDSINESLKNA